MLLENDMLITGTMLITMLVSVYWIARQSNPPEKRNNDHQGNMPLLSIVASLSASVNTAFVVFGAVKMGYEQGLSALFLPFGFFLGDVVFWRFFPRKITQFAQKSKAKNLQDLISDDIQGTLPSALCLLVSGILFIGLLIYTIAQFIGGQKWMTIFFHLFSVNGAHGAYSQMSDWISLFLFGGLIVLYSSIGGFRGSINTDVLMAVVRVVGTITAIVTVSIFAGEHPYSLQHLDLNLLPSGFWTSVSLILGYTMASLGFSLTQPQLMSRYLVAENPQQSRSSKYMYFFFVYTTWCIMVLFGVLLKGALLNSPAPMEQFLWHQLEKDPELALPLFFQIFHPGLLNGIITCHIFASIACAANSMLISMTHCLNQDVLEKHFKLKKPLPFSLTCTGLGIFCLLTAGFCCFDPRISRSLGTVDFTAISAVYLMAGSLSLTIAIRLFGWPHTRWTLLLTTLFGFLGSLLGIKLCSNNTSKLNLVCIVASGLLISLALYMCSFIVIRYRRTRTLLENID